MKTIEIKDALNNAGLPHLADKVKSSFYDLSKDDVKEVINQVKVFDNFYVKGWTDSDTRKTLNYLIDNYVMAFRCYSLLG